MTTKTKIKWRCAAKNRHGEPFHYYASSVAEWKVSNDLGALINAMKREGFAFAVYRVDLPITANYEIEYYVPKVGDKLTFVAEFLHDH